MLQFVYAVKMLSKCCCCVPLRTGSIILAILGIIGGIITLVSAGGQWVYIVNAIFNLIAYGALLLGALRSNDRAVLVNLVFTGLAIAMGIVFGIIVIASITTIVPEFHNNCAAMASQIKQQNITCDQLKAATTGITAAVLFIGSALNTYFWICNYSFYLELKSGNH